MPDFGQYINWQPTGDLEEWYRQSDRGDGVDFMIGHRGVSLVLSRGVTTLDAQDFLLTPAGRNSQATETASESGVGAHEQLLLVGADDADVKRGDRFSYPSTVTRLNYEVVRVERSIYGMLQAYAEERQ